MSDKVSSSDTVWEASQFGTIRPVIHALFILLSSVQRYFNNGTRIDRRNTDKARGRHSLFSQTVLPTDILICCGNSSRFRSVRTTEKVKYISRLMWMDKITGLCAGVSVMFIQFLCILAQTEGHEPRLEVNNQLVRRQGSHSWADERLSHTS
jgi:hypothetical protein